MLFRQLRLPLASAGVGALAVGASCEGEPKRVKQQHVAQALNRRLTASQEPDDDLPYFFTPLVPYPQWDYDWDRRDLTARGQRRSNLPSNPKTRRRHLILIRHGQYREDEFDDVDRTLTPLGREQAALTGKRLAEILTAKGAVCRVLHSSNMARALETADIIAESIPGVPRHVDPGLCEGIPIQNVPGLRQHAAAVYRDGARIEAAFRRYFKRALPHDETDDDDDDDEFAPSGTFDPPTGDGPTDEYDVVVGHSNVIRYMLLRALQLPPEAWLRFATMNCSITHLTISPSGLVSARLLGDVGHLPIDHVTFGFYEGFNW